MSYRAKKESVLQIAPRYREASCTLKTVILDEFVAAIANRFPYFEIKSFALSSFN